MLFAGLFYLTPPNDKRQGKEARNLGLGLALALLGAVLCTVERLLFQYLR